MRRADAPVRPMMKDYDDVVERSIDRRKAGLLARRDDVEIAYLAYPAGKGRPHLTDRTDGWGDPDVGWQKAIYEHTYKDGWLKDLGGAVYAAARGTCLLCNAAQPGTIDHLLPQSLYPALSIFAPNLIGACADCNRIKSNTSNNNPREQFVHPYFEDIPRDVPFLRADVIVNGVLSPQFQIVDHPQIDEELTARLRWQFNLLEMNGYYRHQAVLFFEEKQYGWQEVAEIGWAELAASLSGDLRSATRPRGVNFWKCAFLQGLLDSAEFQAEPLRYLTIDVASLFAAEQPVPAE